MSRYKLEEAFNLPPLELVVKENELNSIVPASVAITKTSEELKQEENEKKVEQDLDNVRLTQYELIQKGKESIDELIEFAKASESPRAWEVVANLIKTTSDVADSLAKTSLEKQKQKSAANKKDSNNSTNITNNSLFIGSTAELQKLLQQGNKQEDENV